MSPVVFALFHAILAALFLLLLIIRELGDGSRFGKITDAILVLVNITLVLWHLSRM